MEVDVMANNVWEAELYDNKHAFVSEYGKDVVAYGFIRNHDYESKKQISSYPF